MQGIAQALRQAHGKLNLALLSHPFGSPPRGQKHSSVRGPLVRQAHHKLSDVPGYADKLEGEDRDVLKLRPGITGTATLKYRLEDEQIAAFAASVRANDIKTKNHSTELSNRKFVLPENVKEMTDQKLAVWYNDNVIYPDKVRLNKYYYEHYSFVKDIQMIFATIQRTE